MKQAIYKYDKFNNVSDVSHFLKQLLLEIWIIINKKLILIKLDVVCLFTRYPLFDKT